MTAKELTAQLTLEEKASLCSGKDFWHTKPVERLGLEALMVTDGPHGLRKQREGADHLGILDSVPATCFPAACASTCSFDRELLGEIGDAIAEECLEERVAVILGPAANIKRSPLCGRNFEYMSEDPYLTGETAAALIAGIQARGVGVSLKHYAANNQETRRMTSDSIIDERALREIYLAGFERAVRKARPWTLICSYNLINGTYVNENKKILSDILRDEWGFDGIVMSDWGAVSDRVNGIKAGMDLEMPGNGGLNDRKILAAVKAGVLSEEDLDRVVERLVGFALKGRRGSREYRYDREAHHALARKAAGASAVLLKNEGGLLPLAPGGTVAVIGAFAKTPRYQGAGSSKINPHRIDSPLEELEKMGYSCAFAAGYPLGKAGDDEAALIAEAAALAAGRDAAVVFAGLPDEYESEGFDRRGMAMPESHTRLIEAVAAANPNTVVVLQCGAPVATPWAGAVKAVLLLYLGGEAAGGAAADLLSGAVTPSGKLAETWPAALGDNPSFNYFPGKKTVEYRESVFVGYRYYDTAGVAPAWPFGHGLSYTTFELSGLRLDRERFAPGGVLRATVTVKNTGSRRGAEVVQIYVAPRLPDPVVFRPAKTLAAYEKVWLDPGESRTVTLVLDGRSFAYYNTAAAAWSVEGGPYAVLAGVSSADIRLSALVTVEGDGREAALRSLKGAAPVYYAPGSALAGGSFTVPDAAFAAVYGGPLPPAERLPGEPFTVNSTLGEIKDHPLGRQLIEMARGQMAAFASGGGDVAAMLDAMFQDMPLRSLGMMSGGQFSGDQIDALLAGLNGAA